MSSQNKMQEAEKMCHVYRLLQAYASTFAANFKLSACTLHTKSLSHTYT